MGSLVNSLLRSPLILLPSELHPDLSLAVPFAAPDESLGTFIRLRSLLNRAVRGLVRGPANAPVQRLVRASGRSTCGAC